MNTDAIIIRKPKESDIDVLQEIRNDRELQALLLARYRPNDREAVIKWLEGRDKKENEALFVVARSEGQCLGFVQLVNIDKKSKLAFLGVCIHPKYQGLGVGKRAIELTHEYAMKELGITKVVLEVKASNTLAIRLYEQLNYRLVGTLKNHFFLGGDYHDVVIMECIIGGR